MRSMSARARTIAITAVAGALLALTPPVAQAAKPFRLPGELTVSTMSFGRPGDLSDLCGFPLDAVFTSRESFTVFSSGAALITGTYKVSFTNANTRTTINVNASGPGRFDVTDPSGNGSGTGAQLYMLGADEALGGGIWLFHGKTSFTRDPVSGGIATVTWTGARSGNLCAQLA